MLSIVRSVALGVTFVACLLTATLSAQADQKEDVQAVEDYLNGITTLSARFVQTANDGTQSKGDFMLKRPGRMRFQYDPPMKDFITADGLLIYYYDGQMKQQSSAPISKSLADFFLRKDLKLSGDVVVSKVQRGGGLLQVTLQQSADKAAGALTLGLTEKPLTLKKWRVVDTQGAITEVELSEIETGVRISNELFRYYDPQLHTPKYN